MPETPQDDETTYDHQEALVARRRVLEHRQALLAKALEAAGPEPAPVDVSSIVETERAALRAEAQRAHYRGQA